MFETELLRKNIYNSLGKVTHIKCIYAPLFRVIIDINYFIRLSTGEFSAQSPVTRNFDIFFDLRLKKKKGWANNRASGNSRRHLTYHDITVMQRVKTEFWWVLCTATNRCPWPVILCQQQYTSLVPSDDLAYSDLTKLVKIFSEICVDPDWCSLFLPRKHSSWYSFWGCTEVRNILEMYIAVTKPGV